MLRILKRLSQATDIAHWAIIQMMGKQYNDCDAGNSCYYDNLVFVVVINDFQ